MTDWCDRQIISNWNSLLTDTYLYDAWCVCHVASSESSSTRGIQCVKVEEHTLLQNAVYTFRPPLTKWSKLPPQSPWHAANFEWCNPQSIFSLTLTRIGQDTEYSVEYSVAYTYVANQFRYPVLGRPKWVGQISEFTLTRGTFFHVSMGVGPDRSRIHLI